jgi:hypothetical protein
MSADYAPCHIGARLDVFKSKPLRNVVNADALYYPSIES